jgi:hypothetical protein
MLEQALEAIQRKIARRRLGLERGCALHMGRNIATRAGANYPIDR